jgi:GNAT superfamily N-acetyltransferase
LTGQEVVVAWAGTDEAFDRAADVLIRLMLQDTAYISHSEIHWGLSKDGLQWSEDADRQLRDYLAWVRAEPSAEIATATASDGALAGVAVVTWSTAMPGRFATIEDVVVEPAARGSGVGARLVAFVEAEAKARGCRWLFLESGVRNTRAHAFFEREGFAPTSHTFAKALDGDAA